MGQESISVGTSINESKVEEIKRTIESLVEELKKNLGFSLQIMEGIDKDLELINSFIVISSGDKKTELESIRDDMLASKAKLAESLESLRAEIEKHTKFLTEANEEDEQRRAKLLEKFEGTKQ